MELKKTCHRCRDCTLQAHVQHDFGKKFTPVDVFIKILNAQELIDRIVSRTSIYVAQKGCNFLTNHDKSKVFLKINYLMGINEFPSVANYWEVDHYIRNDGIKNVMPWQRFQDILQNLHFANNDQDDKRQNGRALYIMFGIIHNIVPSNLPLFLSKSSMERFSILGIVASTFSRPAT